ncbi:MAG: type II toxin-antitoxin system HicB family antitoxin [Methanomassiliicoccaceae archaeon]|nr:type II toxin-antitoxin system HicB family antitoxin [Methanomassiliicoccaceae archaeon]
MPKVSVRISDDIHKKLKAEAKEYGTSMSRLVCCWLSGCVNGWSPDFFTVSGSLKDYPLDIPEELSWSLDAPREQLGDVWPNGHFEKYVGSIKDKTFKEPKDGPWTPGEDEKFN